MCDHDYKRLGYLMVYTGEDFCPLGEDKEKGIKGAYEGYTGVAPTIVVSQCTQCGDIKFSNGVLEKICQESQS